MTAMTNRARAWSEQEALHTSALGQLLEGARLGMICSTLVPLRVATLLAVFLLLSVLGMIVLCLNSVCCGCRFVGQYRTTKGGKGQCRCRAAGSEQLQRSVPKRVFLFIARPLVRMTLFVWGFYWVQDCAVAGYKYDARACVVTNQGGLIELAFFIWNFPGVVVADTICHSATFLPILAAMGVCDASMVEQLEPLVERSETQDSALAQYQALMALHNETHAGIHFGLPRLCLMLPQPEHGDDVWLDDDTALDGCFAGGLPLQPIWVRRGGMAESGLRILTQFTNTMEVLLLPLYRPSEIELLSPQIYKDNLLAHLWGAGSSQKRRKISAGSVNSKPPTLPNVQRVRLSAASVAGWPA